MQSYGRELQLGMISFGRWLCGLLDTATARKKTASNTNNVKTIEIRRYELAEIVL